LIPLYSTIPSVGRSLSLILARHAPSLVKLPTFRIQSPYASESIGSRCAKGVQLLTVSRHTLGEVEYPPVAHHPDHLEVIDGDRQVPV
jgi:hypothetical protein